MSTDETDRLKPLRQGGVCVLVSVEGRASTAKKRPVPLQERDGFLAISP